MVGNDELALFSLTVYEEDPANAIAPPDGWTRSDLSYVDNLEGTGFAADVYKSAAGEYVISFRGTDDDSAIAGLLTGADWYNNVAAGSGVESRQVELALDLVARVLQQSSNITFTGHSLGGGLAGSRWSYRVLLGRHVRKGKQGGDSHGRNRAGSSWYRNWNREIFFPGTAVEKSIEELGQGPKKCRR